ncbi:lactamase [Clostridium carboxidivorans P7]|uniref:Beta-lactamase domain protein n=1 Tax=Clostridium carboxidivorans P7 TaxID=536227 RepID=C6PV46_9CLOT|nr:MBL fold metallo-hydrolase [Clostridium carboxidivorans]AKN33805.1 lactamase [Clostridium carboxidivorans P7]EET86864.1 beta-lactamase domain protein [Clostridium carboxidivorans P7]EFG86585.1 metallo-beta-lactamase domain protein [Clostridium carboxidivorans P7]
MIEISKDLYQSSAHIPFMHFTLHQYLLLTEEPVLVSTGTMQQAEQVLPEIKKLLNGKELKYILFPHIESDECGGLPVFLKEYPNVITVCSELSARELSGFGYKGEIQSKKHGELLTGNGFLFKFIDYPSEVHLQNGVVFYEETRKIFFSSDLMLRFGDAIGQTIDSSWKEEVGAINIERIPNENQLETLKNSLLEIEPKFIAVGHGFCVNCK